MSLKYDNIVDRVLLKTRLVRWKFIAFFSVFVVVVLMAITTAMSTTSLSIGQLFRDGDLIARLTIDDVIDDDCIRHDALSKVKADKRVKALIVRINSPGGSSGASEALYRKLSSIEKPVVVVMGSIAASGGYLVALAGDHIFANATTLTGSIGVVMRFFNVEALAKKVGVSSEEIKTSELKASPSPFSEVSEESRKYWKEVIGNTYDYFVSVVEFRRNLPKELVLRIADGRVYTGTQALELGLIDAIGGEDEALQWIKDNHSTIVNPTVKDIKIKKSTPISTILTKQLVSMIYKTVSSEYLLAAMFM